LCKSWKHDVFLLLFPLALAAFWGPRFFVQKLKTRCVFASVSVGPYGFWVLRFFVQKLKTLCVFASVSVGPYGFGVLGSLCRNENTMCFCFCFRWPLNVDLVCLVSRGLQQICCIYIYNWVWVYISLVCVMWCSVKSRVGIRKLCIICPVFTHPVSLIGSLSLSISLSLSF
jgi:hypothetical protein